MLAARDQENLVHGHQTVAASKPLNQGTRGLQPKTPGNKYPKTPLKIPLNDENVPAGFGGKSGKGKGLENMATGGKKNATFDKNAFVTPMGPRNRAPLGQKTTNAKAKVFQTPAGPAPEKELEKTQPKQTSTRRPKKVIHADSVKLEVHGDESPLAERDVEYCPPRPKDLPYESEDFPQGCLNFNPLKPDNLMKGRYQQYHNKVDAQGRTRLERELEESYAKSANDTDERVMKMLEEDWTVDDVPETFRHLRKSSEQKPKAGEPLKKPTANPYKAPGTVISRKAAAALSVAPKATAAPPKTTKPQTKPALPFFSRQKPAPLPLNSSTVRNSVAAAASNSTLGYTKGRSAHSALHKREDVNSIAAAASNSTLGYNKGRSASSALQKRQGMTRSVSNLSQSSDTTITPAKFGQENDEWKSKLSFLSAFDVDDEELEPGLRGALPESLRNDEEDDEEFVMTLGDGTE
ncbi:hypothetical protein LSUE1_G004764 [Lachnellula suecica]|uniref:Uncharacterized protein n=1 Tax=Lachnellula suecica TaxID=602035 RepID=A0A8T9C1Z6_9HELO|nr:hypothetical protein LSUE1_G004764 [Lachnellula suecica]